MESDILLSLASHAVTPQDSTRVACKKILAQQFLLLCEREEGTCSGQDVEDLHRMRVATRRMRSCLRHFEDAFEAGEVEPHHDYLRLLGGRLGEVRDIDTCIRTFKKCLQIMGSQVSEAVGGIIAERRAARETLLDHVRETIQGEEYNVWKRALLDFLVTTDCDADSSPISQTAPVLLLEDFERVLRYRKRAWKAAPAKLHKLRIRCKRFRYLGEFLLTVYDARLPEVVETVLEFQDILGEIQDHHRDNLFLRAEFDRFVKAMTLNGRKKRLKQVLYYLEAVIESNRQLFLSRWRIFTMDENIHRIRYILKNATLR